MSFLKLYERQDLPNGPLYFARRLAAALRQVGVSRGDTVSVMASNTPEVSKHANLGARTTVVNEVLSTN